jgi:hypothetical protein
MRRIHYGGCAIGFTAVKERLATAETSAAFSVMRPELKPRPENEQKKAKTCIAYRLSARDPTFPDAPKQIGSMEYRSPI